MILPPHARAYPRRLLELDEPPVITVSGPAPLDDEPCGPLDGHRVVAIVGSRRAEPEALDWAHQLAFHLAGAGVVVVSGGAAGIDRAAHEGAMKAGATWCVACAGRDAKPFPSQHRDLFRRIEASPGSRMIWPFPSTEAKTSFTPRRRNQTLVALAEAVVVVQARNSSGSMNAASAAFRLRRPRYVVPSHPWDTAYLGSSKLLCEGAVPLVAFHQLFRDLGLPDPNTGDPDAVMSDGLPHLPSISTFKRRGPTLAPRPGFTVDPDSLEPNEKTVFFALSRAPSHQDKIVAKCDLGASLTLTALLTLSLKDVVVEGPDGFFRLRTEA